MQVAVASRRQARLGFLDTPNFAFQIFWMKFFFVFSFEEAQDLSKYFRNIETLRTEWETLDFYR